MARVNFITDTQNQMAAIMAAYNNDYDSPELRKAVEAKIRTYKPEYRNKELVNRIAEYYSRAQFVYQRDKSRQARQVLLSWAQSAAYVYIAIKLGILQ